MTDTTLPSPRRNRVVALRYEHNSAAPRIIARGEGFVAEQLIARAEEAGVPVRAEPELVELLLKLDLNELVPPTLYAAVAEVLAWAYRIDGRETNKAETD